MHPDILDNQVEFNDRLGIVLLRQVDDSIGLVFGLVARSVLIRMLKLGWHLREGFLDTDRYVALDCWKGDFIALK